MACQCATLATTCIVEVLNPGFRGERPANNSMRRSTLAAFGVKDTYARVARLEQWAFPKCTAYSQVPETNIVVRFRVIHAFIKRLTFVPVNLNSWLVMTEAKVVTVERIL